MNTPATRFTARAKGPGLDLMISSDMQALLDACREWADKTWRIVDENGRELAVVQAVVPVQRLLFE